MPILLHRVYGHRWEGRLQTRRRRWGCLEVPAPSFVSSKREKADAVHENAIVLDRDL